MTRFNSLIQSLFRGGFFHIVGAGTLNKAISTVLSIVLVRILSKADYGIYAFAFNIISFFILFNGLGATSAALQLCCELSDDEKKAERIFAYAYRVSIAIGLVFLAMILLVAFLIPLSIPESAPLLALYCSYPLFQQLCDIKIVRLRVQLRNKDYAFATNVQTFAMCVFSIIGAFFAGAVGLVVGQCLSLAVCYAWLCFRYPFSARVFTNAKISMRDTKQYWGISLISAFNNGISQAMTLIGNFLIAALTADELAVSSYKVATTIPFALLFVPSAIVTFIYPYFVQHKDDKVWTIKKYGLVTAGSALLMGCIALFFCIFAEPITALIFGEQYLDSVPAMRILMVGFFITSTFRTLAGNLLVTQRKLIVNSVSGIILIVVCVLASYLLIPTYGMIGSALVYDVCMLIGSILSVGAYLLVINELPSK